MNEQRTRLENRSGNDSYLPARRSDPYAVAGYQAGGPELLQLSQQAEADAGTSLFTLIAVLKKRWKAITAVSLLFFLAALFYVLTTDKLYKATTTLEIRGYAPVLEEASLEQLFGRDSRRAEYQKTTIAKLKQLGLADKVLATDGLADELLAYFNTRITTKSKVKNWYKDTFVRDKPSKPRTTAPLSKKDSHFTYSQSFLASYVGLIDITPVHETNLVHISAVTSDKRLSQKIANTHAKVFIEHLKNERRQGLHENVLALQFHAEELQEKLAEAERKIVDYAGENQLLLLSASGDENLVAKNIVELNNRLAETKAKRIALESALDNSNSGTGENKARIAETRQISLLRSQLETAQAEYASLSKTATANYPPLAELGSKIASLRRAIRSEQARQIGSMSAELRGLKSAEKELAAEVERMRGGCKCRRQQTGELQQTPHGSQLAQEAVRRCSDATQRKRNNCWKHAE